MGFSVILDAKCNEHRIFGWQGCESNAPFFLGSELITMIHNAWKCLARSSWDL